MKESDDMIKICDGWYMEAFRGNNGTDINGLVLYEWDGKYKKEKDGYERKLNCRERYYSSLDSLFEGLYNHMVNKMVDRTATLDELFTKLQEIRNIVLKDKMWIADYIGLEPSRIVPEATSIPRIINMLARMEKAFEKDTDERT